MPLRTVYERTKWEEGKGRCEARENEGHQMKARAKGKELLLPSWIVLALRMLSYLLKWTRWLVYLPSVPKIRSVCSFIIPRITFVLLATA